MYVYSHQHTLHFVLWQMCNQKRQKIWKDRNVHGLSSANDCDWKPRTYALKFERINFWSRAVKDSVIIASTCIYCKSLLDYYIVKNALSRNTVMPGVPVQQVNLLSETLGMAQTEGNSIHCHV